MAIDESKVKEILRLKGDYLYHRESQELEFKEQFSFGSLADYLRDFAAFANNRGGHLIFGVQDSPRVPIGLSKSSLDQFDSIDPQKISGFLLEFFSSDIYWNQAVIDIHRKSFGVFHIHEAILKPVIAKKDGGRDQEIKIGEIYYRYGGRTQRIQYAELENIITRRIEDNNRQWQDLVQRIGQAGPSNVAILDTERSLIETRSDQILVLDEKLSDKLRFIKSGEFEEEKGKTALKLVGDIVPIKQVEVIRKVKEDRLRRYPLSAMELAREIERRLIHSNRNDIWKAIKDNGIKKNPDYSMYNFRNKTHQDEYEATGHIHPGTPSIYNNDAVEFLIRALEIDK